MPHPDPEPANDQELWLSNQLCFPIYAAANAVTKAYRPHLTPLGLTYPQYLVMMVLWQTDAQSVGAIGRKLHLDSGTLTPLLKRLETQGVVRRSRSAADERVVLVSLTDLGRSLKDRARAIPRALSKNLHLTLEQAIALKSGLEALFAGAEA